ncbi:DUF6056 family protein [Citrobacter braakii]|uniref:DUF6056 family protein n=1 Tax=Citrobacter braakii TaxID=57706 RepID=UPI0029656478|nr:DUF6056 family protein [Citrobacter braakii]MDW2592594.1 DUF6056 family protein [Citrobacter braakii]MDW2656543.1 DUF6056 family protein [Citrobacter braakii]MDW2704258.1 DUF6056 family protein [Citrobacter braakii]
MLANKYKTIPHVIFWAVIAWYLFDNINIMSGTDDMFFATITQKMSLYDFTALRYKTWSGRYLIEAFMVKTINIVYAPQLIIISSFAMLSHSISRIASDNGCVSLSSITIASILILAVPGTSSQAILWVSGGYNYILPFALGVYALSNLMHEKHRALPVSLAALFFSCNNEQFGAVALLAIVITTAARKHKKLTVKYEIIYLVTAAVSFFSNILAPGNKARLLAEIPNWTPDFNNLSLLDKITIGMDRLNNHVHYPDNITLFIFCLIALFIASRKNGFSLITCAAILFCGMHVLYFISTFYPKFSFYHTKMLLPEFIRADSAVPDSWSSVSLYTSYALSMLTILSAFFAVADDKKSQSSFWKIILVMLCGVASAVMIGLSPTAYASGSRVMFIFDIAVVIGILTALNKQYDKSPQ